MSHYQCYSETAAERDLPAALPYAGTSGWSGSDASREATEERDRSGRTGEVQSAVWQWTWGRGQWRAPVLAWREPFPQWPHGRICSALTCLHKSGRLLRLTQKRDRASICVAPAWQMGRATVPPKVKRRTKSVRVDFD